MVEKVFALFALWYSRQPSRQRPKMKGKGGQEEEWQKKGRKIFRALCAMVSEVAKVDFGDLFFMKAKKVMFIRIALVRHESRGKGDFGR